LSRNESGRFGALKSDSTHHFFRNACTKSGSLRFSQFSGCWLILSVYILNSEFWLSLCKIVRSSVILLLPLFVSIWVHPQCLMEPVLCFYVLSLICVLCPHLLVSLDCLLLFSVTLFKRRQWILTKNVSTCTI
jgi:hypothetical protein